MGITFKGIPGARRKLGKRIDRATNLRPAWLLIDKSFSLMERRQFQTSGAFGGRVWAPLRPATREARLKKPGGNRGGLSRPLWDEARLKHSLEQVGPESIRVIRAKVFQRGTRVPYGVLHQSGFVVRSWGPVTFKVPRRVAPRQPIPDPIPEPVRRSWVRILARHLTAAATP